MASFNNSGTFSSTRDRRVWIATYTLFMTYILSLLLKSFQLWGRDRKAQAGANEAAGAAPPPAEGTTPATGRRGFFNRYGWSGGSLGGLGNGAETSRDAFLILLGMVLINQAGHGITSAVETLVWIVFSLLVLRWLASFFTLNIIVEWLLFFPAFILASIAFGLSFIGDDPLE